MEWNRIFLLCIIGFTISVLKPGIGIDEVSGVLHPRLSPDGKRIAGCTPVILAGSMPR